MGKRPVGVTLRKPPQANVDTFVASANDTKETSSVFGEVVPTTRGVDLREVTVYLPKDLARKFALHCHELDRDASKVLAEMLEGNLVPDAQATVLEPMSRWERLRGQILDLVRERFPIGI